MPTVMRRALESGSLVLLVLSLGACAAQPPCAAAAPAPQSGGLDTSGAVPEARLNAKDAAPQQAHDQHAHDQHAHDGAGHDGHTHDGHTHDAGTTPASGGTPSQGVVVAHGPLAHFENNGNDLVGIATRGQGAREHEVWRSTIAVGSHTPLHRHESEEIFVFLRGKGRAEIGGHAVDFEAPATVIAPAGVPHQFFNTGSEPTDAIVIVSIGSTIWDKQGAPMQLPWRR